MGLTPCPEGGSHLVLSGPRPLSRHQQQVATRCQLLPTPRGQGAGLWRAAVSAPASSSEASAPAAGRGTQRGPCPLPSCSRGSRGSPPKPAPTPGELFKPCLGPRGPPALPAAPSRGIKAGCQALRLRAGSAAGPTPPPAAPPRYPPGPSGLQRSPPEPRCPPLCLPSPAGSGRCRARRPPWRWAGGERGGGEAGLGPAASRRALLRRRRRQPGRCGAAAPLPPPRHARHGPARSDRGCEALGEEEKGSGRAWGCWGGSRGSQGSGVALLAALEMLRENTRNRPKMSPEGALGSLSQP